MTEQKFCGAEGHEQEGRNYETVRTVRTSNVCPSITDSTLGLHEIAPSWTSESNLVTHLRGKNSISKK
jgi:hypothetical protein